jgi:hypothetical protein
MDSTEHAANSIKNGAVKAVVGRPTKFSSSVVEALCEALADGMPIKGACVVAGICVTTLSEWREKRPEIEERMSEARERARQKALQRIKSAGEKDWRADAEWLRLTFPADYRGTGNKIEVSATESVSPVVMTEERRLARIERDAKPLRTRCNGVAVRRHQGPLLRFESPPGVGETRKNQRRLSAPLPCLFDRRAD